MAANWKQESFGAKDFGNLEKKFLFIFFACVGSALKSLSAGCEGDEEADSMALW